MTNPTTEPTQSIRERLAFALWKHDYGGSDEFWESSVAPDSKEYHARRVDAILSELMEPGNQFFDRLNSAFLSRAERPSWEAIAAAWQEAIQHIQDGGK